MPLPPGSTPLRPSFERIAVDDPLASLTDSSPYIASNNTLEARKSLRSRSTTMSGFSAARSPVHSMETRSSPYRSPVRSRTDFEGQRSSPAPLRLASPGSVIKNESTAVRSNRHMHYRGNFDESRGYVSPSNNEPPPLIMPPSTGRNTAWMDDDLPFDQRGDSSDAANLPFDQLRHSDAANPTNQPFDQLRHSDVVNATNQPFDQLRHSDTAHLTKQPFDQLGNNVAWSPPRNRPFNELGRSAVDPPAERSIPIVSPEARESQLQERRTSPDGERRSGSKVQRLRAYFNQNQHLEGGNRGLVTDDDSEEAEQWDRSRGQRWRMDDNLGKREISKNNGYEEFCLSPSSATDGSKSPDSKSSTLSVQARGPGDDDDSLFDFPEIHRRGVDSTNAPRGPVETGTPNRRAALKKVMQRRARRSRRSEVVEDEDDDTSLENDYGVARPVANTGLQERAQQAFSSRNKTSRNSAVAARRPGVPIVSFDDKPDTVYHFEQEEDNTTQISITDRSLNSEYTKSMDSEVEDIINDLFFLGSGAGRNPGRRPFKYHPMNRSNKTAKRLKDEQITEIDEESTLFTFEDSTLNDNEVSGKEAKPERQTQVSSDRALSVDDGIQPKETKRIPDDEFVAMWGFVEGSVSAVSEALGLSAECVDSDETGKKSSEVQQPTEVKQSGSTPDGRVNNAADLMVGSSEESNASKVSARLILRQGGVSSTPMICTRQEIAGKVQEENGFNENDSSTGEDVETKISVGGPHVDSTELTRSRSLENDPHLSELVLHAARIKHEINGCSYDEKTDITTQVMFNVVKVGLPLGSKSGNRKTKRQHQGPFLSNFCVQFCSRRTKVVAGLLRCFRRETRLFIAKVTRSRLETSLQRLMEPARLGWMSMTSAHSLRLQQIRLR